MNFNEWYNKFNPDETGYTFNHLDYAEFGWDACKKEVLKILKSRTQHEDNGNGGGRNFIHTIAIEDIENL